MPVRIRLQRRGRKKQPFYHIIVADVRAPRDGRFIEQIGMYNPMTKPATIELDREKALDWLMKGAQPTDTARAILRFKGVLYRKHLLRGVHKGALTQELADEKYNAWIEEKEAKIAARRKATADEIRAFHAQVSGTVKKYAPKEEAVAEESTAPKKQPQMTLAEEAEAKAKGEAEASGAEETEAASTEEATEAKEQKPASGETPAEEPAAEEEPVTEEEPAQAEEASEATAGSEEAEAQEPESGEAVEEKPVAKAEAAEEEPAIEKEKETPAEPEIEAAEEPRPAEAESPEVKSPEVETAEAETKAETPEEEKADEEE